MSSSEWDHPTEGLTYILRLPLVLQGEVVHIGVGSARDRLHLVDLALPALLLPNQLGVRRSPAVPAVHAPRSPWQHRHCHGYVSMAFSAGVDGKTVGKCALVSWSQWFVVAPKVYLFGFFIFCFNTKSISGFVVEVERWIKKVMVLLCEIFTHSCIHNKGNY